MELDIKLDEFFKSLNKQNFSKTEVGEICKPLYNLKRRNWQKKWLYILMLLCLAYLLLIYSDGVQWFLTALGRLVLIQLLPYWNWPSLYNAKCLIERSTNNKATSSPKSYESNRINCLLCDDIDYIPTVGNVTFSLLESSYLERGLPVVILDSHESINLNDFFQLIFTKSSDFLDSSHCDVSTNLVLNKFFDADIVLKKAWQLLDITDKWFVQLRSCTFKSVKSSRLFIRRPYYYPVHLEPFYSSWLLVSHNFNRPYYQEINVQGLIIIQQLWGSIDLRLMPQHSCVDECPNLNVHLEQGEGFVFSSDLWILKYKFTKNHQQSITTIMEIDWTI